MKDRLQKVNEKNVGKNGYDENEFRHRYMIFFFFEKNVISKA